MALPGARSVSVLSDPHSVASTVVPALSCGVAGHGGKARPRACRPSRPRSEASPRPRGSPCPSPPCRHLDEVVLAEVGGLQLEVSEVEAQAVAGGRRQGPVLLVVVGIRAWEARRCQAPEHGLGPLRARGRGGCRAPQQTQGDQQPEDSAGEGR